jgi:hypothetical protein
LETSWSKSSTHFWNQRKIPGPYSPSCLNFSIMKECTPERGHCHSVFSLWVYRAVNLLVLSSVLTHIYFYYKLESEHFKQIGSANRKSANGKSANC